MQKWRIIPFPTQDTCCISKNQQNPKTRPLRLITPLDSPPDVGQYKGHGTPFLLHSTVKTMVWQACFFTHSCIEGIYIPLATSTTVLSGLDFCANCDFCVKSWVRGICMWRILWFWCFLMIQRRIRVLHVDQFGRSQDRSRPVFVPTQTNSNEKGIQGLQGFYFFCANCIKRDELIEPTGPNRSFHFV